MLAAGACDVWLRITDGAVDARDPVVPDDIAGFAVDAAVVVAIPQVHICPHMSTHAHPPSKGSHCHSPSKLVGLGLDKYSGMKISMVCLNMYK